MIEVTIDDKTISKAKKKAKEMGELNNSITKGEGNLAGFIGEFLVADFFGGEINNTYDYDVIIQGKKIDVKTKNTTVKPQKYYLATVAAFNTKQKCDSYYFVRIDLKNKKGYLLGGMSKNSFFKKAEFYKKGDTDPSSDLGWTFTADCYNLPISELKMA